MKRVILEDGKPPEFIGAWTVGEVLAMAQQLAGWVERLQVSQPTQPTPTTPPTSPQTHSAAKGNG